MIPLSASNLLTYRTCPKKFNEQYNLKSFTSKFDSPAAIRGIVLHELLRMAVDAGDISDEQMEVKVGRGKRLVSWADFRVEAVACRPALEIIFAVKRQGWRVETERELCVNRAGKLCGWWDADCLGRGKVDVLAVSPDGKVIIWDWKTGKAANINPLQMPFLSLLAHSTGLGKIFNTLDFLIDNGQEPVKHAYEAPTDLTSFVMGRAKAEGDFLELDQTVRRLRQSFIDNAWPAATHYGCRWCEVAVCREGGR